MPRQGLAPARRNVRPAIAGNAVGEDDFAGGLDRRGALPFDVQTEMPSRRLDAHQAGAVAHRNVEKSPVPGEVFRPGLARDALEGGVRGAAVAGLVPSLKAQGRNAELR